MSQALLNRWKVKRTFFNLFFNEIYIFNKLLTNINTYNIPSIIKVCKLNVFNFNK